VAVDRSTVTAGTELPVFVRTTGFHNWNRYAAVNDEFVPIHMDDDAGRAQGFPGAFGMGNLMWSYLHNLVRDWMGDDGRIVTMACSFRSPNLRGMTVEARGTVTAVRDEGGERLVDLELSVVDHDTPDTVLVPATATVALP
jgi:acyl dehydratase